MAAAPCPAMVSAWPRLTGGEASFGLDQVALGRGHRRAARSPTPAGRDPVIPSAADAITGACPAPDRQQGSRINT